MQDGVLCCKKMIRDKCDTAVCVNISAQCARGEQIVIIALLRNKISRNIHSVMIYSINLNIITAPEKPRTPGSGCTYHCPLNIFYMRIFSMMHI